MNLENSRSKINKKLFVSIFSFFFLVNVVSSGGHLDWWDGMEAFLVTESMVIKHSAKLHPDVPTLEVLPFDIRYSVHTNKVIQTGDTTLDKDTIPMEPVYTVRSLFLSAIGVPFYHLGLLLSVPPIDIIGLFVNSLILALTSVVIFYFSYYIYHSKWISFALSLIFGMCSFAWPYHTSFWVQPLQGLTLISGTYFLYMAIHYHASGFVSTVAKHEYNNQLGSSVINRYDTSNPRRRTDFITLGGVFLGLSIFAHPTSIVLMPGFIIYAITSLRHVKKRLILYFLIALSSTSFLVGLVNFLRFGEFTEFGYGSFSSLEKHNGWAGLIGLLFSPGAGLVFYFPISALLILSAKYMYNTRNRGFLLLCAFVIIANWLYVGTLSFEFEPYAWSGAVAWGPRYFVPVLPFVTIVLGQLLVHLTEINDRKKRLILKTSVIGLASLGFCINLVGTLVWSQYGIMYGWDREKLSELANRMDTMTWNPYYSPIVLHSKALAEDFVSTIHPEKYVNTSWYWTSYGLAPCSYDNYIFCKFGVGAVVALSIPIVLIGIGILIQIGREKSIVVKRWG